MCIRTGILNIIIKINLKITYYEKNAIKNFLKNSPKLANPKGLFSKLLFLLYTQLYI